MPTQCSVCQHPDRAAIDDAIRQGTVRRVIERRFNLKHATFMRHAAHVPPEAPASAGAPAQPERRPGDAPTRDDMAMFPRWCSMAQQTVPDAPEAMLAVLFTSDGTASTETLARACGWGHEDAEAWRRHLEVHLIAPHHYAAVFAAEDALAEHRVQWSNYQADCRATSQRLAELQTQIEETLAYSHLGEQQASEVQARLEALDRERVDLLRHQGDLPGVGQRIQAALETAAVVLGEAEAALHHAQVAHLQEVEAAWLAEAAALLEPLRTLLHQAHTLDQAWERLGTKPSTETGRGRLKEAVLAALRTA